MSSTATHLAELPVEQRGHLVAPRGTIRALYIRDEAPTLFDGYYECSYCGKHPGMSIQDNHVVLDSDCPSPEGMTTVVEITVPSGRIIVADDLRGVYAVEDAGFASYNTVLGQAQYVEAMAAIGCAYGPVGNTCPSLYRTGSDSFVIASPAYDESDEPSSSQPGTFLASICTDLWAYSIADYEDWLSKGGDHARFHGTETVVEITPGTYRFTHHTGERTFDSDAEGPIIFAHIERIR